MELIRGKPAEVTTHHAIDPRWQEIIDLRYAYLGKPLPFRGVPEHELLPPEAEIGILGHETLRQHHFKFSTRDRENTHGLPKIGKSGFVVFSHCPIQTKNIIVPDPKRSDSPTHLFTAYAGELDEIGIDTHFDPRHLIPSHVQMLYRGDLEKGQFPIRVRNALVEVFSRNSVLRAA